MLLITRTEPGATELATALETKGIDCVVAPALAIVPLRPWQARINDAPVPAQGVDLAQTPNLVIALSTHAVREFVAAGLAANIAGAQCVAVGERTALELRAAGFAVDAPDLPTSEGLLQMPALAGLAAGAVVWILAGVGGRDLVNKHLRDVTGAHVVKFELYQRQRVAMRSFPADPIAAVVVGSEEGLAAFAEQWRVQHGKLNKPLIVPSQRVAAAAGKLGFEAVEVADGMDAESIWGALQALEN